MTTLTGHANARILYTYPSYALYRHIRLNSSCCRWWLCRS